MCKQISYLNQIKRFPLSAILKTFATPPTCEVPNTMTIRIDTIIEENCNVSVHITALDQKMFLKYYLLFLKYIKYLPQSTKCRVEYADTANNWSYHMKINTRHYE